MTNDAKDSTNDAEYKYTVYSDDEKLRTWLLDLPIFFHKE